MSSATTSGLAETAAPLDMLLVDAAPGPVRGFVPDMSTAKWAVSLARQPGLTARRLRELGAEAGRVLTGASTVAPQRGDRRFADVAWAENPLLRRLVQLYLAGGQTVEQLVIDADLGPRDRKRVQFFLENLIQATAPSNVPLVNPASAKAVIDTAGLSLVRGAKQLARDLASAPRIPEMVDGGARTVLGGVCSGGILASITAAYLAGIGRQERLAALCLAVTVIDNHDAGTASALVDERLASRAKAKSARKGYLDGRALAEVFAWLRPGDLVWNYWVNNYLLGQRPPAFDILFWNSDTTRMTAALHADFIDLAMQNSLTRPGALTVLGVPIDLGQITVDSYVVAGVADHITPWENCYRSAQLLGGTTRFVLSTSGHIAALVNPPGNPKASFHTDDDLTSDARVWLKGSDVHPGTWWTDLGWWLDERSGGQRPAPKELGSHRLGVLAEAPGTYVFDK